MFVEPNDPNIGFFSSNGLTPLGERAIGRFFSGDPLIDGGKLAANEPNFTDSDNNSELSPWWWTGGGSPWAGNWGWNSVESEPLLSAETDPSVDPFAVVQHSVVETFSSISTESNGILGQLPAEADFLAGF